MICFYSLANKKSISVDRRTLDKISGEKAGEIKVVLGTDSEDVAVQTARESLHS